MRCHSVACGTPEPLTSRCDSDFNDAGNVIEAHEHIGDFAKHLSSASRARNNRPFFRSHTRYLTECLGMWNSQRSSKFTTDRDQVFDEIVLIRIGHLDCDPLPPINFRAVVETPDQDSPGSDCRGDDWRKVPDRRVRLKRSLSVVAQPWLTAQVLAIGVLQQRHFLVIIRVQHDCGRRIGLHSP